MPDTSVCLADMRRNYIRDGLLEESSPDDPYLLFDQWLGHAMETELPPYEANAMLLSTVDENGQPHARVMLLKAVDEQGFVFYTNYQSDKGAQLQVRPRAAITFYWPVLERQVRVEGRIEQVTGLESDEYYAIRPLGSRLGAWASPQSRQITGRQELNSRLAEVHQRFSGDENPPRPPHWGGYRLLPNRIEFWQGRPDRLHDRLNYRLDNGGWLQERLAP